MPIKIISSLESEYVNLMTLLRANMLFLRTCPGSTNVPMYISVGLISIILKI